MRRTHFNPDRFHPNQIPMYLVLVPLAIFMAIPIVFIINHAFKPIDELFAFPPRFLVENPVTDNFTRLARQASAGGISISRYIFNSLVATVSVVLLSMAMSSMAAFALSKLRFRGKSALMEINNLAMMFVPVAVIIPRYLLVDKLGMINTYFAHILPLVAMPVGMFLVKQFTDQVPDSLIEAAIVDGANLCQRIWHIDIPSILPTICILLIIQCGNILSVGYEKIYLMQNNLNASTSEVISTYVYKQGLQSSTPQYSYSTAIGLFTSVVNLMMLVNKLTNKLSGSGLW